MLRSVTLLFLFITGLSFSGILLAQTSSQEQLKYVYRGIDNPILIPEAYSLKGKVTLEVSGALLLQTTRGYAIRPESSLTEICILRIGEKTKAGVVWQDSLVFHILELPKMQCRAGVITDPHSSLSMLRANPFLRVEGTYSSFREKSFIIKSYRAIMLRPGLAPCVFWIKTGRFSDEFLEACMREGGGFLVLFDEIVAQGGYAGNAEVMLKPIQVSIWKEKDGSIVSFRSKITGWVRDMQEVTKTEFLVDTDKPMREGINLKNVQDSLWKVFEVNGERISLSSECFYRKGKLIWEKSYYPNGRIKDSSYYYNTDSIRYISHYYEHGPMQYEGNVSLKPVYLNGFEFIGDSISLAKYTACLRTGDVCDSELFDSVLYRMSLPLVGLWKFYYPTGMQRAEGEFELSVKGYREPKCYLGLGAEMLYCGKNGLWRYYNSQGNLEGQKLFTLGFPLD